VTVAAHRQVAAVLRLRVAMLRGRSRRRAGAGAALGALLLAACLASGPLLPTGEISDLVLLLPSAWLLFAVGAAIASATGAGGREMLDREQAVAFPLSPAADSLGALLLTPLNLSWLLQSAVVLTGTSWAVGRSWGAPLAWLLAGLWIAAATAAALAVGWVVEILRTAAGGVWLLRVLMLASAAAALGVVLTGRVASLLDAAPTAGLVGRTLAAGRGDLGAFWPAALGLLAATGAAVAAGIALAAVLHRRPPRAQVIAESRPHRRRRDPGSQLRGAVRVDQAGVWRSAPMRRGILALGALPGGAAAVTGLDWQLVALLPGLVASGAALLFGVNALCLDGTGALWRESLPGSPLVLLTARLVVVGQCCLAGAVIALVAAGLRAPGRPTGQQLLAIGCALLVATVQVVARCAQWSIDRPYPAALRGPRDQPAPPAAMAGYSTRLALSTTLTGLLFAGLGDWGDPVSTLLIALGLLLLAVRRLVGVARRWRDPVTRGRVLAVVTASGG